MPGRKKFFILDTNVLLHDYQSIFNFQEHDIIIPIVVLEELDKFKKGNDIINFHARELTRQLDKLAGDKLFTAGVSLGKGRGKLFIETGKPFSERMLTSFPEDTPDHRILAIAEYVTANHPGHKVILVSKDINLRLKAKSLNILAQDYRTDKVFNIDDLFNEVQILEDANPQVISSLYSEKRCVPVSKVKLPEKPFAHQYFIIRNEKSSVLAHYDPFNHKVERVEKITAYGIEPRNAEQAFSLDALLRKEIQLVALTGKAGTGKTLLALAAALHQRREYKQIFLARPIVPLANRDMGFLPGDVSEKIEPYMQPLFDNLSVIKNKFSPQSKDYQRIDRMLQDEKLVITPLAYIRGRSLSNIFFIVDEAQNLTPHEVKTIITRAGEGTKLIFTGDIEQIDSPYLDTVQRTHIPDRQDAGTGHLCSCEPGEGRTQLPGRAGQSDLMNKRYGP